MISGFENGNNTTWFTDFGPWKGEHHFYWLLGIFGENCITFTTNSAYVFRKKDKALVTGFWLLKRIIPLFLFGGSGPWLGIPFIAWLHWWTGGTRPGDLFLIHDFRTRLDSSIWSYRSRSRGFGHQRRTIRRRWGIRFDTPMGLAFSSPKCRIGGVCNTTEHEIHTPTALHGIIPIVCTHRAY